MNYVDFELILIMKICCMIFHNRTVFHELHHKCIILCFLFIKFSWFNPKQLQLTISTLQDLSNDILTRQAFFIFLFISK